MNHRIIALDLLVCDTGKAAVAFICVGIFLGASSSVNVCLFESRVHIIVVQDYEIGESSLGLNGIGSRLAEQKNASSENQFISHFSS